MNEDKDCMIFHYNELHQLEQLTVWITEQMAKEYARDKSYYGSSEKVVLKKIEF